MCILQKTTNDVSRFAFVVSTKVAKHAVDRNRMKRVLRESVHHLLPTIKPGYDVVFVAKKNFAEKTEIEVKNEMQEIFSGKLR
jgi:ribonuclease P protein component